MSLGSDTGDAHCSFFQIAGGLFSYLCIEIAQSLRDRDVDVSRMVEREKDALCLRDLHL